MRQLVLSSLILVVVVCPCGGCVAPQKKYIESHCIQALLLPGQMPPPISGTTSGPPQEGELACGN
jgi:hypothetical protein